MIELRQGIEGYELVRGWLVCDQRLRLKIRLSSLYPSNVTVLEGIQKSTEFLDRKGVESPRLNAELLLAHQLKLPRMKLYLNFDRVLNQEETDSFRGLVLRRSQREPLQHIIGSTSFCGLDIRVSRHALVPRQETELLAETGWKFLASRETKLPCALDFGTGSGCIAIAMAARVPSARILAIDASHEALELARNNAAQNQVAEQIIFEFGTSLAGIAVTNGSSPSRFDLLISNPPYVSTGEISSLPPEVRDFDPRQALDGGADGLDYYRLFAKDAHGLLKKDGRLMLEFGDGQEHALADLFSTQNWIVTEILRDYTQRPRILIAQEREASVQTE